MTDGAILSTYELRIELVGRFISHNLVKLSYLGYDFSVVLYPTYWTMQAHCLCGASLYGRQCAVCSEGFITDQTYWSSLGDYASWAEWLILPMERVGKRNYFEAVLLGLEAEAKLTELSAGLTPENLTDDGFLYRQELGLHV